MLAVPEPTDDTRRHAPQGAPQDVPPGAGPEAGEAVIPRHGQPVVGAASAHGTAGGNPVAPRELGGPKGPDPTRYGDWERGGRCIDF